MPSWEQYLSLLHNEQTTDIDRNQESDGGKITSVTMHRHVAERAQETLDRAILFTGLRNCKPGPLRVWLALHTGIVAEKTPRVAPPHWQPSWRFYPQPLLADVDGKPPPIKLPSVQEVAAWYGWNVATVERYERDAEKAIDDADEAASGTFSHE